MRSWPLPQIRRIYDEAKSICIDELGNGNILDSEYEDRQALGELGIRFAREHTNEIFRGVSYNGVTVPGFFSQI